jgi:bifunctional DNase/RNase
LQKSEIALGLSLCVNETQKQQLGMQRMKKVKLNILGLSSGQSSGSYTLILGEDGGRRKLPIVIGSFEAQAIAIEIEKIIPFRPMTHDLFVNFTQTFNVQILEVMIYDLVEGVFHAKMVCEQNSEIYEIDSRTSDAIALAVRFKCPVYANEEILQVAGVIFDDDEENDLQYNDNEEELASAASGLAQFSVEELEDKLSEALSAEDYHTAAQIRDEINKRNK